MATPVITPVTQFGWAWLKAHERLVMLALVLAVGSFGISKYFDVDAARKDARVVAAEQIVANDQKNSAAQALATAQMQSQYTALVQALATQNASLEASMAQRNTGLVAQQHKDSFATMAEAVGRWQALVPAVNFDGAPVTDNNGIAVNLANARATIIELEKVPVLIQNLADETTLAGNYQAEVLKADALVIDQKTQITVLNKSLTDQAKESTLQIAAIKAEGKKNSVKWFKRGFIVGFLSGIFAGHAAGI
jgi:hypothetical protein